MSSFTPMLLPGSFAFKRLPRIFNFVPLSCIFALKHFCIFTIVLLPGVFALKHLPSIFASSGLFNHLPSIFAFTYISGSFALKYHRSIFALTRHGSIFSLYRASKHFLTLYSLDGLRGFCSPDELLVPNAFASFRIFS